ncbi:hypothetical protein CHS0354_011548 [Potamilus streckersoni]|uniref:Uncharacterized protein n=1 Tax=Potamilus streckersoni TaxID=2493646 RepID=A0AAE0VXS7_9BIVA|nr:hypothetical protein CHS0354_011548 [Potamilus streckersoni]
MSYTLEEDKLPYLMGCYRHFQRVLQRYKLEYYTVFKGTRWNTTQFAKVQDGILHRLQRYEMEYCTVCKGTKWNTTQFEKVQDGTLHSLQRYKMEYYTVSKGRVMCAEIMTGTFLSYDSPASSVLPNIRKKIDGKTMTKYKAMHGYKASQAKAFAITIATNYFEEVNDGLQKDFTRRHGSIELSDDVFCLLFLV